MPQTMLSKLIVVFGLLMVLGSALSTSSMPKLVAQTPFTTQQPMYNVLTSPHGVKGSTSPFIVGGRGELLSFSAAGKLLARRTFANAEKLSGSLSMMNVDANGNTVFVTTTESGTLAAFSAETLKPKWAHNVSHTVLIDLGFTYVGPEVATQCSGGAGGVAFVSAGPMGTDYNLQLYDFETGSPCRDPVALPSTHTFQKDQVRFQSFPSGGALKRPMIVVVDTNTEMLFGIDAESGTFKYKIGVNASTGLSFDSFVAGTSPTTEYFAYNLQNFTNWQQSNNTLVIRSIATGDVVQHHQIDTTNFEWLNFPSLGWSASNDPIGSISIMGFNKVKNCYGMASISASTGAMIFRDDQNKFIDAASFTSIPVVNVANQWSVGMFMNSNMTTFSMLGFSNNNNAVFTATLPPVSNTGNPVATGVLLPFTFAHDGSIGMVVVVASYVHNKQNDGSISVFRV